MNRPIIMYFKLATSWLIGILCWGVGSMGWHISHSNFHRQDAPMIIRVKREEWLDRPRMICKLLSLVYGLRVTLLVRLGQIMMWKLLSLHGTMVLKVLRKDYLGHRPKFHKINSAGRGQDKGQQIIKLNKIKHYKCSNERPLPSNHSCQVKKKVTKQEENQW